MKDLVNGSRKISPWAEIPTMMSKSNYCKYQKNPYEHGAQLGLAIPLVWTKDEADNKHLVPGSVSNPWNEKEEEMFVLALYIFGKSFDKVKRFIGNRTMGDILSFYYEKFCKSEKHRRWKQCKESINCAFGEDIFTPPCLHKILSRIQPNVTQKCYLDILEVSWLYTSESKLKLEEYVLALKRIIGMDALVEAIGIGKGEEQDLTAQEFRKATPEIPVGKECSDLTQREIINIIKTHRTVINEAQSNDLFWEAVWPRLLLRGWHIVERKGSHTHASVDYSSSPSLNKLLFFTPGVVAFSGKRVVKGKHYFDSISDILHNVVSNPETIELPSNEAQVNDGRGEVMVLDGGDDTIGKGKGVASEANGRRSVGRVRQATIKVLEALESDGKCRRIEKRKRSTVVERDSLVPR